jgi:hypothetical protein
VKGVRARGGGALLALVVLAGILLVFYWKTLVGIPGGRTFFWEDFLEQNYPYRAFAAEEVRAGRLPFWNPFQFGGMPFVADIQAATFYPPNLLLALFVSDGRLDPWWVEAESVAHALLGGFFLFLLVRRWTGSAFASLFSGAAWALSGFFVVRMIHLNVLCVTAWAPLVLLFALLAAERRSLTAAILGGIALGFSTLGGSPQYTFYVLVPLGLFALLEAVRPERTGTRGGARRFRTLAFAAVTVLAGFGVAAVQLLPTAELSPLSVRSEMTYEKSIECSFGPASFSTLLMPQLYGTVAGRDMGGYRGPGRYYSFWELCAYTGIAVLLLAAAALLFRRWDRTATLLVVVGGFGLLLGLGGYGPLHAILRKIVPVYAQFRCPGRALVLFGLSLAALAGLGMRRIEEPPSAGRGKWGFAAFTAFLFVGGTVGFLAARADGIAAGRLPGGSGGALRAFVLFLLFLAASAAPLLAWAFGRRPLSFRVRAFVFAVLLAELFTYGMGFNDGGADPERYYRGEKNVIDLLRKESAGGLYRVKTRAEEGMILPRNVGSVVRIPSVDGYNQLKLRRYEDLHVSRSLPGARVLDLLGVRVFAEFDPSVRGLRLARNEDCFPKALFVGRAERRGPGAPLLERLGSASFDPRSAVLLEGEEGEENLGGSGTATVTEWGPGRIAVEVDARGPGYLVLSENAYPAWRARVDGRETPTLPADHALRAVRLEAGKRTVVWEYRSGAFRRGLGITVGILLLGAVLVFVLGPRRGDGIGALWKGAGPGEAR